MYNMGGCWAVTLHLTIRKVSVMPEGVVSIRYGRDRSLNTEVKEWINF